MTRSKIEEILNNKVDIFEERAHNNKSRYIKANNRHNKRNEGIKREEMRQKEIENKIKEEQMKIEIIEKKNKLKEEILRKIQIEEEERLKIEDELADVRSEEIRIINFMNMDDNKHNNRHVIDRFNFEEYN